MERPAAVRIARLVAIVVAVGLAVHPIHARYLHLELQEHFPRNAVVAIAQRDWAPFGLHHGAAFFDLLRAVYTVWFAAGHALGTYPTRLHFLAAFLEDPFPFVVVGRVLVVAAALLGCALACRLGARLWGAAAATASLLFLGVSFGWVREVHHVWIDAPAATMALAATAAALRLQASGTLGAALGAGALAGVALATKHSMFPVVVPVALAALHAPRAGAAAAAARLVTAGAATAGAFFLLSPYAIIKWRETLATLQLLNSILFATPVATLSLSEAIGLAFGWAIPALAAAGLVAAVREAPARTVVLASFPLCYLGVLARANAIYLRHLTALAPFLALFAGYGALVVARAAVRRRPGPALAVVAALVAAAPAWHSVRFVRFLQRTDTREQAGAWIRANVPPGTPLALPNAVRYPNPIVPPGSIMLQLEYPKQAAALRAPEFAHLVDVYPTTYLAAFDRFSQWKPVSGYVVEARHPVMLTGMNFPPALHDALGRAGAKEVARFTAVPAPPPEGLVYDPLDADYVPLRGFDRLERPGPNLIVWALPR